MVFFPVTNKRSLWKRLLLTKGVGLKGFFPPPPGTLHQMLQTLPNQRAWTKGSAATLAKKVSKPRGGGVRSKLDNRSWWLGDVGERPEFSSGNVVSDKFVMENPTNSQSFNGDILWIYMCGFVVRYVHVQLLLTSVDYMYQYLVSMSPNQFCSNFCFFYIVSIQSSNICLWTYVSFHLSIALSIYLLSYASSI